MPSHILELSGPQSAGVFKALASDTRIKILDLLATREMNINELCQELNISQPSVTKHIQLLEEAGLVNSDYSAGAQGMQKRCHNAYDRIVVAFEGGSASDEHVNEVEMPIGLYTGATPMPTCGLAGQKGCLGFIDDPLAFHFPERADAQILWMADGCIDYVFPNTLSPAVTVHMLELIMEVGSEAPGYNNDYPSDITVWVNGVEIGTWRSPGDMGGRRGRLNPPWWNDIMNQFGFLKVWSVDATGSYVDGVQVSSVNFADLKVVAWQPINVRIGIKPDAECRGGFTLFGKGFGNYEQDLVLRLHHSGKRKVQPPAGNATSEG